MRVLVCGLTDLEDPQRVLFLSRSRHTRPWNVPIAYISFKTKSLIVVVVNHLCPSTSIRLESRSCWLEKLRQPRHQDEESFEGGGRPQGRPAERGAMHLWRRVDPATPVVRPNNYGLCGPITRRNRLLHCRDHRVQQEAIQRRATAPPGALLHRIQELEGGGRCNCNVRGLFCLTPQTVDYYL